MLVCTSSNTRGLGGAAGACMCLLDFPLSCTKSQAAELSVLMKEESFSEVCALTKMCWLLWHSLLSYCTWLSLLLFLWITIRPSGSCSYYSCCLPLLTASVSVRSIDWCRRCELFLPSPTFLSTVFLLSWCSPGCYGTCGQHSSSPARAVKQEYFQLINVFWHHTKC